MGRLLFLTLNGWPIRRRRSQSGHMTGVTSLKGKLTEGRVKHRSLHRLFLISFWCLSVGNLNRHRFRKQCVCVCERGSCRQTEGQAELISLVYSQVILGFDFSRRCLFCISASLLPDTQRKQMNKKFSWLLAYICSLWGSLCSCMCIGAI